MRKDIHLFILNTKYIQSTQYVRKSHASIMANKCIAKDDREERFSFIHT